MHEIHSDKLFCEYKYTYLIDLRTHSYFAE